MSQETDAATAERVVERGRSGRGVVVAQPVRYFFGEGNVLEADDWSVRVGPGEKKEEDDGPSEPTTPTDVYEMIDDGAGMDITPDRTDHFSLATGQFRDPATGEFEPGGAPPDADLTVDRYRSDVTGQFKSRPADHFDEPAEVRLDSLEPEG